jgi:hypothetical protein
MKVVVSGPQDETAIDRGLVEEEVYWHEIVNVSYAKQGP